VRVIPSNSLSSFLRSPAIQHLLYTHQPLIRHDADPLASHSDRFLSGCFLSPGDFFTFLLCARPSAPGLRSPIDDYLPSFPLGSSSPTPVFFLVFTAKASPCFLLCADLSPSVRDLCPPHGFPFLFPLRLSYPLQPSLILLGTAFYPRPPGRGLFWWARSPNRESSPPSRAVFFPPLIGLQLHFCGPGPLFLRPVRPLERLIQACVTNLRDRPA